MDQHIDRVTEAYEGKLGEQFAEKTRERIHWVVKQTTGYHILDVGCSQGITSILLGREGKQVTGIDIAKPAIAHAMDSLAQEAENVQQQIHFIEGDFLHQQLSEAEFDTILLTEVLEHFTSSREILKKAATLLKKDGQVIITVPFGVNDYPDHKRTLYFNEIYQELSDYFEVKEVEFFGKWIGFSAKKTGRIHSPVKPEWFEKTEKAFYQIERELLNFKTTQSPAIRSLKTELKDQQKQLRTLAKEKEMLHVQLENWKNQAESNKTSSKSRETEQKEMLDFYKQHNEELKQELQANKVLHQKREDKHQAELKEKDVYLKGMQKDTQKLQTNMALAALKLDHERQLREEEGKSGSKLQRALDKLENKEQETAKENKQLRFQAGEWQTEVTNYARQTAGLQQTISQLEKQLQQAQQEAAVVKEQNKQLSNQLQESRLHAVKVQTQLETIDPLHHPLGKTFPERIQKYETGGGQIEPFSPGNQRMESEYSRELQEVKTQLLEQTEKTEQLLTDLIKETKNRESIERKYNALSNSKLGRVTIKYWSLRRKSRTWRRKKS